MVLVIFNFEKNIKEKLWLEKSSNTYIGDGQACPGVQSVQVSFPESPSVCWPAEHGTGLRIFVAQLCPAGHSVQLPSPARLYSPELHSIGVSCKGHLYPAGQRPHVKDLCQNQNTYTRNIYMENNSI